MQHFDHETIQASSRAVDDWPPDGLERVEQCPVCGCGDRHLLYHGLTDRVFRCAPGHWELYECGGCRSAYLDPRPTPATIHLAYQHYYTHAQPQDGSAEDLPGWRRFKRSLVNGYRNRRFGGAFRPTSRLGSWVVPLFPQRKQSLERELRYLPPIEPGGRLLDVGFGSGAFMRLAQRVGWRVAGADPDPVTVVNARKAGLEVRQGGVEAFADMPGQFDVVTLSHVIEHVHDPVDTLSDAYKLLKPGGQLYIETPNIDAYGHSRFKEHWRGLEIPRHLVIFNWLSMIDLLRAIGFHELRQVYSYSPYAHLADASRSIRNGIDPYRNPRRRMRDRIDEAFFSWSPLSDKKRTEFITLNALKKS